MRVGLKSGVIMYRRKDIVTVFDKMELKEGLSKYIEIMERLHNTDVSKDQDFQRLYNHFYRMRQRKPEFYKMYYDYMEKMKNSTDALSFEEIFLFIQKESGRCESSFSSKLLATLDPNKPVWDMYVLENLGIKKIYSTTTNREQKILAAYNQICEWHEDFLKTDDARIIIEIFDEMFPGVNITDTKKVDLFLWQFRN